MSFGAFMEGLQGGVKSGQNIRRERQLDDIYDAARRKIKNEEAADDIGREARGLPKGDATKLGDPFGQQLWDWASGLFGKGDDAAPADPGAAALQDKVERVDSLTPNDGFASDGMDYYADGGKPSQEELDREEKAKRYGVTAKQAIPAVGNVVGTAVGAGPKMTRGALHGLAGVVEAGTDDPIDAGRLGKTGAMLEYAVDAPRVALGRGLRWAGDKIGGIVEPGAPKEAIPTPAAPAPRGTRPGAPPSAVARKPSAPAAAIPAPGAAPAPTAEKPVMAPEVIAKIPWDKVDPMTLPKFKTQDWVKYRETAIDQMVMRGGGVTVADAMDKVDQQVIGMQQRGTKALLQEAIMRVQAGDLKGAGNALVAMFQYVPSGTDAVVGTYNGQLVAQFIDEATGQPVGDPTPVDGKMLGDLWQQYANPAAWAQMAQDRVRTDLAGKELGLRERLLEEVQIPEAQSNADYRAMAGKAAITKAIGGGGDDGLKPSEQLAIDEDVRKTVEKAVLWADEDGNPLHPQLQNPNIQTALLAAIMKMKRQTGKPSEEILLEILNAAKE